jgi:hypothetical protein
VICSPFTEGGYEIGLDEFNVANNLVLFSMEDGTEMPITTQPDDLSPEKFILRSRPAWSPDGSQIAWTEFYYPERTQSLMIYDLEADASRAVLEDMPAEGDSPLAKVAWGEPGIAYDHSTFETSGDGLLNQAVTFLSPEGEILYTAEVDIITPRIRFTFGSMWLKVDGQWQYGVLFNDATWQIFDPAAQQTRIVEAMPVLIPAASTTADQGVAYLADESDYDVYMVEGDEMQYLKTLEYLFDIFRGGIAVSPDATDAAFDTSSGLRLWTNQERQAVPGTEELYIQQLLWSDAVFELVILPED